VVDAVLEGVERRAVVEVGHGDLMPGGAELVGEGPDAGRQALSVMEHHDICHEHPTY
jgi:hypothetical protein